MARLTVGKLTEAWKGEASDFTPLLAEQLDSIGAEIGVDLAAIGEYEVSTTGGRRIDIVAQGADGTEFVIENQYGRADHDHLTRGLAYAVARRARGLIVVAEEHRDEFRAVAQYLNDLAEHDDERGIAVWLIEARAVRIEDSSWAPLFVPVVEPNQFTMAVEQEKKAERPRSIDELLNRFPSSENRDAARDVVARWTDAGFRYWIMPTQISLVAPAPSKGGQRVVVGLKTDGSVGVPFTSYEGSNSGVAITELLTPEFRDETNELFGFTGTQRQPSTSPGWLTANRVDTLLAFCHRVADAYRGALSD